MDSKTEERIERLEAYLGEAREEASLAQEKVKRLEDALRVMDDEARKSLGSQRPGVPPQYIREIYKLHDALSASEARVRELQQAVNAIVDYENAEEEAAAYALCRKLYKPAHPAEGRFGKCSDCDAPAVSASGQCFTHFKFRGGADGR